MSRREPLGLQTHGGDDHLLLGDAHLEVPPRWVVPANRTEYLRASAWAWPGCSTSPPTPAAAMRPSSQAAAAHRRWCPAWGVLRVDIRLGEA
jgi:hypothetical protein